MELNAHEVGPVDVIGEGQAGVSDVAAVRNHLQQVLSSYRFIPIDPLLAGLRRYICPSASSSSFASLLPRSCSAWPAISLQLPCQSKVWP